MSGMRPSPDRSDEPRINEQIRASRVRLVDEDGEQLGVKTIQEALSYSRDRGLDLVEVAQKTDPPVCRLLNFSKYRYEREKKLKDARKHQKGGQLKTLRLRLKIGAHDLEFKVNQMAAFLEARNKVKVSVFFRGREMEYPDMGRALLQRVKDRLGEVAVVEQEESMMGNNMNVILAPKR